MDSPFSATRIAVSDLGGPEQPTAHTGETQTLSSLHETKSRKRLKTALACELSRVSQLQPPPPTDRGQMCRRWRRPSPAFQGRATRLCAPLLSARWAPCCSWRRPFPYCPWAGACQLTDRPNRPGRSHERHGTSAPYSDAAHALVQGHRVAPAALLGDPIANTADVALRLSAQSAWYRYWAAL